MEYDALLDEANAEGISVKERPFKTYDGRLKGKDIYLRKDMNTTEKTCVLAEEMGHHYTTVGDILDTNDLENCKQEHKARFWAYNKQIGLDGLIDAYEHGCRSAHEIAAFLEVTDKFLIDCVEAYRSKYGEMIPSGKYTVCFIPHLMIMKKV